MAQPTAASGASPVPEADASDTREAAASPGPFRAVLVTAGEINPSIGGAMDRSGSQARGAAIWNDQADATSTAALDEDVALAQAAAQAAMTIPLTATAHPPNRVMPPGAPPAASCRSPAIDRLPSVSRYGLPRAKESRRPTSASDAVPVPPAAPARESSIRTVSVLAIATASREADAIAHNGVQAGAAASMKPSAGRAKPDATGSATMSPATPGAAIGLRESAIADIAHDPPGPASTATAGHHTGGNAAAAVFQTPVVATHRVPAGLVRSLAVGTSRAARAVTDPAAATIAPAPPITPMPVVDPSATPRTPLEQAVHDLIGRIGQEPDTARTPDAPLVSGLGAEMMLVRIPSTPQAPPITRPAPASEPGRSGLHTRPPEPPANPSHVHLVVDDGPERVVVTVAIRGNDVHVALRGSDDATTAAFARNAAGLDHAMRARGLTLGELTVEREPPQRSRHQSEPPPPPPRHQPDAEPFELEETP